MPTSVFNIPASTSEINPSRTISGNSKRSHLRPRYRSACRRIGGLTEIQHSRLRRYKAHLKSKGGVCDWSMSQWASHFKISKSQFRRDANAWVEHGHILRIHRDGTEYISDTYLWMLLPLASVGGGSINGGELQELNTTTTVPTVPVVAPPAPPAPPAVREVPAISYHRVKCEWRWELNHSPRKREIYEYNGLLIRQNAALRGIVRGKHYGRGRPDPMVGAGERPDGYYSAQPHESDADREYREEYQRRQNEHKMNTKVLGGVDGKQGKFEKETEASGERGGGYCRLYSQAVGRREREAVPENTQQIRRDASAGGKD